MKFSNFNLSTTLCTLAVIVVALIDSSSDSNTFITTTNAQVADNNNNDVVRNENDIPMTAINAGMFTTLVAALSATDLVGALSSPAGPFTVFAPTDDAFDLLPDGLVGCLLEEDNLPILSDILLYHVASGEVGEVLSTDLSNGMTIPTMLQGQNVVVDLNNGNGRGVKINDSTVTTADVLATNGVIHIINEVLVPPSVDVAAFLTTCGGGGGDGNDSGSGSPSLVDIPTTAVNAGIFNTLVAAFGAANLVDAVSSPNGPFTVFAPTDAAFASLPDELVPCLLEKDNLPTLSDILLYHVVSGKTLSTGLTDGMNIPTLLQRQSIVVDLSNGSGVKINDSTVTTPDVLATNGVIHIIDQVLVPPSVNVAAFLSTCHSEPVVVVDVVSEDCIYLGVWRSANQRLTGPTHTCLCTHGGHWTNCRANTQSDTIQTQTQTSTTTNSLVDIPTTAINAGIFSTLVAALSATDLVGAISDPKGPFTVFAPNDDAFNALPNGLVSCLLEEKNLPILSDILLYHVASGKALSTDLSNGQQVSTLLDGAEVTVDLNNGVMINDSTVVGADMLASNGVIHVLNQVLVPPSVDVGVFLQTCNAGSSSSASSSSSLVDIPTTAINAGIFSTLVAALSATDLVGVISEPAGPFTVFAPNDDAFNALPTGLVSCLLEENNLPILSDILSYHVAPGKALSTDLSNGQQISTLLEGGKVTVDLNNGGVKINGSTVLGADVLASNGVIHVLNQVLVPPTVDVGAFLQTCSNTGASSSSSSSSSSLVDIPTTAINAGIFSTLVAALSATDLVDVLSEPNGPFTVFAPNDDAFNALPDGLVGCLLEENNLPILSDILLYHVTSGKALSTDLSNGQQISTLLDGGKVTVDLNNSGVKINESNVIGADVLASNGVIHIIDAVLVPSQIDVGAFLQTCRTNSSAITGPVTTATTNSNSNQSIEQFSGGLESDTSLLSSSSTSTSMSSGSADSITNESIIGQFGVMESNTSSSSSSLYSFSFLISFVSTIITLVVLY